MQPRAIRLCPGVKGGSPAIPAYLSQSQIFFFPQLNSSLISPFLWAHSRPTYQESHFISIPSYQKGSHMLIAKVSNPPLRDNVLHSTHTHTQLLNFQANKISHPNRNHLVNVITSHLQKSVSV